MKPSRETIRHGLQVTSGLALAVLLIAGTGASRQAKKVESKPSTNLIYSVKGVDLYRAHCAVCHGLDGKGDGPAAAALKDKPPDLTILSKLNGGMFPAAKVKKTISGDQIAGAHGSREMPIWGPIFHQIEYDQDLGDVRLVNLTKYLESIQQK